MLSPSTRRPVRMPRVGGFLDEEISIADGDPQWQTVPFCGGTNFQSKSTPESTQALRPQSLLMQAEFERACRDGLIVERRLSLDVTSSPLLSKVWQAMLWSTIQLLGLDPVFWIIKNGKEYNILKQFDAVSKEDVDAHIRKLKNGGLPWPNENGVVKNSNNNVPCEFDLYNLKWSGILLQNSIGVDLYARLFVSSPTCLLNSEDTSGPELVFAIAETMAAMQHQEIELPERPDQQTVEAAYDSPTLATITQQLNDLQALITLKKSEQQPLVQDDYEFNSNDDNQPQQLAADPRTTMAAGHQQGDSSERQEGNNGKGQWTAETTLYITSERDDNFDDPSNTTQPPLIRLCNRHDDDDDDDDDPNSSSVLVTTEATTPPLYPNNAEEPERRVYTKQDLLKYVVVISFTCVCVCLFLFLLANLIPIPHSQHRQTQRPVFLIGKTCKSSRNEHCQ